MRQTIMFSVRKEALLIKKNNLRIKIMIILIKLFIWKS